MTLSHTAQGLASLGRNGDSMLVHMSPEEVGGLKQIGDSLGIKMSTNPHTGMPEAFSFGDFFTSFLPTIVGAAVGGPAGGGIMSSMTPILAGAGTGALLAAAKGDDPLMGGLMGGMGGYGGAGLRTTMGNAFGSAGKAAGTTAGAIDDLITAQTNMAQTIPGGSMVGNVSPMGGIAPNFDPKNIVSSFDFADDAVIAAGQKFPNYSPVSPGAGTVSSSALPPLQEPINIATAPDFSPIPGATQGVGGYSTAPLDIVGKNLSDLGTGVTNLTGFGDMSISDAYKKFTDAGGTAMDLAMPVGGGVLAGLEPSDLGYGGEDIYNDPDKGKYRGPQGQLNLSDKYDTGLRLVAKGGYIKGYALGGAVDPNPPEGGGISDLYNRPEGQISGPISSDRYGIGRLSNLAGEQSLTQARTLGYARGGYLNGDGDGMSDSIPATIEGKQPARLADGEFVIPADVVSHLGNGSSKAGSKRLYAMLDKVRQARTGNKKQGKEIKAEKYLPA